MQYEFMMAVQQNFCFGASERWCSSHTLWFTAMKWQRNTVFFSCEICLRAYHWISGNESCLNICTNMRCYCKKWARQKNCIGILSFSLDTSWLCVYYYSMLCSCWAYFVVQCICTYFFVCRCISSACVLKCHTQFPLECSYSVQPITRKLFAITKLSEHTTSISWKTWIKLRERLQ